MSVQSRRRSFLISGQPSRAFFAPAAQTAVLALAALLCAAPSVAFAQFGPPLVVAAGVSQVSDIAAAHVFAATVQPARRVVVGSPVDGGVEEFMVEEGSFVPKGGPLAQLRVRQIELQISVAKANRDLSQRELEELKNGARPEEIREAEGRLQAAKASMEYSQSKLRRTQGLFQRGAATEDQLQDDTSASAVASANYATAQATFDLIVAGPRAERIAQAEARLAAASEELARLEDLLEKHTIRSYFDGYVVKEYTEIGAWIKQGDAVAELVELDAVDVVAQVLESYAVRLPLGTVVRVEFDALPGESFEGPVTAIVAEADQQSRSFPVKIRLRNRLLPDGAPLLKPGMFARAVLPVEQKKVVLLVAKDALVLSSGQPKVFCLDPLPKAPPSAAGPASGPSPPQQLAPGQEMAVVREVPVTLGVSVGHMVEVSGIRPNDRVVVEGNEGLMNGATVIVLRTVAAEGTAAR